MRAGLAALLWLITAVAAAGDETLARLEQQTRLEPQSVSVWDRYGVALARERRFPEAHRAFDRALALAPKDMNVLRHVALAHAWSGDYDEATRRLRELVARYPGELDIRVDYGEVLAWDRKYAEAQRQYRIVLQVDRLHVEATRHLGVLQAWQGNYDEALHLLERAAALAPKDVQVLADQAEVLSWKGDLTASADAYVRAAALAPERIDLLLKLAQVYRWHERSRPAVETYERVLALDPDNRDGLLGLVRTYRANRQFSDAERVLKPALARAPNDAELNRERAALAAEQNVQLRRIVELAEPPFFIVVLLGLAWHLWRYRRVLRRGHGALPWLMSGLPLLALLMAGVYIALVVGGAYHREVELAADVIEVLALAAMLVMMLTLVWVMRFEQPRRAQTVLAIGAHPDDLEFGCGATLLRLREQGSRTHALILTSGERGNGEGAEANPRVQEAHAGAKVLALDSVEMLAFPDTQLREHKDAIRAAIEERVKALKPDIVFTHNSHDAHTDHRTVHEATREGVRGPCTILCYENPNTPPAFTPNFFMDVEGYLDDKIAALGRHKSQLDKPYARPEVIRASAAFRGNQARVEFAEGFEVVRWLDRVSV